MTSPRLSLVVLFALLVLGASAAVAQESLVEPPAINPVTCNVELDGRKLVRSHGSTSSSIVEDQTEPIPLAQPLGPGLVSVSGIHEDPRHADPSAPDQLDERFFLIFVDADGETVGFSERTPDLPRSAVRQEFRLEPVSLDGRAVAVILVHAGPGVGANSIRPVCLELSPIISLPVPPPAAAPQALRGIACDPALVPVGTRCLRLPVPEVRGDPASRMITLQAYVLPATGPGPVADPIFYLRGGPGGSGIGAIDLLADFEALRRSREVVVVDQRGTGFSEPALTCPEVGTAEETVAAGGRADIAAAWRACNTRLRAAGIPLEAYSTEAAAADLEDLRAALGAPMVNLYGTSYGTSVALEMMDAFPASVRSAVLDGPYPPNVNGVGDDPRALHWLLDIVPAVCGADPACSGRFPDVRGDIVRSVDALDAAPVSLPIGGRVVKVNGLLLLSLVIADVSRPEIPALFHELASGDSDRQVAALMNFTPRGLSVQALEGPVARDTDRQQRLDLAQGAFASATCAEEHPFAASPATLFPRTQWSPRIDAILASRSRLLDFVCDNWEIAPAPATATRAVQSDIPTLVLAGGADPQTPLPWAALTMQGLSQGTLAVIPRGGHVVSLAGNPCARGVMATFLSDPALAPDLACTKSEPPIAYGTQPLMPPRGQLPPPAAQVASPPV